MLRCLSACAPQQCCVNLWPPASDLLRSDGSGKGGGRGGDMRVFLDKSATLRPAGNQSPGLWKPRCRTAVSGQHLFSVFLCYWVCRYAEQQHEANMPALSNDYVRLVLVLGHIVPIVPRRCERAFRARRREGKESQVTSRDDGPMGWMGCSDAIGPDS